LESISGLTVVTFTALVVLLKTDRVTGIDVVVVEDDGIVIVAVDGSGVIKDVDVDGGGGGGLVR